MEPIRRSILEERDTSDTLVLLMSFGMTRGLASKILKAYGKDTIKVLKENPYRIAEDVKGVGFQKADRIAEAFEIPKDSPFRIKAAILYVLERIVDDGHTCFALEGFLALCEKDLKISRELASKATRQLKEEGKVETEDRGEVFVFPSPLFLAENYVARRLKEMLEFRLDRRLIDSNAYLKRIESDIGLALSSEQREALRVCLGEGVSIVTGAPGTGKTTLVKALILLCKRMGLRIVLCAPTGRAARRLNEVTSFEAKKIHRLLEFNPEENRFRKDERYPLTGGVFDVDEVSMADLPLMYHLLKAVPKGARLVFVEDSDQLPSVGTRNVLRDLIASGVVGTVRLGTISRQYLGSAIVLNAHRINSGFMPFVRTRDRLPSDFLFFQIEEPEAVLKKIKELLKGGVRALDREIDPRRDIHVLTPMYRGISGVANLNVELQDVLNPSGAPFDVGGRKFRLEDRSCS